MKQPHPVVEYLQQYEPVSLLTLLSAGIAYPANAIFLERFEYLVDKALSTSEPHGTRRATSQDLEQILASIPDTDAGWLAQTEDFIPQNNLDDVRFCWRGRSWRFFFGNLERPLAYLEKLTAEGTALDEWIRAEYEFSLEAVIDFTLAYHDYLLTNLTEFSEANGSSLPGPSYPPQFVLPSEEFLEFWRSILPMTIEDLMRFASNHDETWSWMQLFTQEIGSGGVDPESSIHPLGPTTFVMFWEHVLVPLPQLGIEQLLNQLAFLVEQAKEQQPEIAEQFKEHTCYRAIRSSLRLFSDRKMSQVIPDVSVSSGESEVPLPIVVTIDTDKVLLGSVAVSLGSQEELDLAVKESVSQLSTAKAIFESDRIRQVIVRDEQGDTSELSLRPGRVETICILIVNILGLDDHIIRLPENPQGVFEVIPLMSYEALAQACDDGLEFIKFLRAWHQLKSEVDSWLVWDILDAYEYYSSNDYTFLRAGTIPNFILFEPHSWSNAEHERLTAKSELQRLLCEEGISDHVLVHPKQDDAWRLFDPMSLLGWMIIPRRDGESRLVLHISTKASNAEEVELNEPLAEVLIFHLRQWGESFWEFCQNQLGFRWNRIEVFLHSEQVIREKLKNNSILSALDQHPTATFVAVGTFAQKNTGLEPLFAIVYRVNLLQEALMGSDNRAERQFVVTLLEEIATASRGVHHRCGDLIREFVERHLPLGRKAISTTPIDTLQTRPAMTKPRALQEADTAWANMMVARHLRERSIDPGKYSEKEAITLNTEIISPFLLQLVEDALSQHPATQLVIWTYDQLEQAESYRRLRRQQLSADYQQNLYLEYDPVESLVELETQLAVHVEALSLLLEIIVKNQPSGSLPLSWERWDRIFALTDLFYQVVIVDETIRFDLRRTTLKISEDYAIAVESEEEGTIDLASFQFRRAKWQLPSHYKVLKTQDVEEATPQSLLAARPELTEIAEAFKACYGVDIEDFMVIVLGLASYPLNSANPYGRLVVASVPEICETVSGIVQGVNSAVIQKVLDPLTLTADHMKGVEINPRKQRERQERLTTRPIIEIELEGQALLAFGPWFVERTLRIWQSYVDEGRLPLRGQDIPRPLRVALDAYRQQRTSQFEETVRQRCEDVGITAQRVKDKHLISALGISESENPGEIDVLVVVPQAKKILVLEAKDITRSVTPRQIAREFRRFYDDGYINQLERKVNFILNNLREVLHWLGHNDREDWEVVGAFVTRSVVPTAFAARSAFPFVAIDELESWLISQITN